MKLSISNIAWSAEQDAIVYDLMKKFNFQGLEIAPTRSLGKNPYDDLSKAETWYTELKNSYGFQIPSMQSIWYGRQENLFGSDEERAQLADYTKAAINFAEVIGCKNLVFGCPKNRSFAAGVDTKIAVEFFRRLGNYAENHHTVIAMEANPAIYNTNYINTTTEALNLIEEVAVKGFRLNLDVGTLIANDENISILREKVHLINHVHISEPYLKPIEKRNLHVELANLLRQENYSRFVSIEMGKVENISVLENVMNYVRKLFDENF